MPPARGVRVRVLVDDLHATGQDALFAGLATPPNVEVRMFNPLPVRGGGVVRARRCCRCTSSRASTAACTTSCSSPTTASRSPAGATSPTSTSSAAAGQLHRHGRAGDRPGGGASCRRCSTRYWNSEYAYPIASLAGARRRATPRARRSTRRRRRAAAAAVGRRRARPSSVAAAAGRRPGRAGAWPRRRHRRRAAQGGRRPRRRRAVADAPRSTCSPRRAARC